MLLVRVLSCAQYHFLRWCCSANMGPARTFVHVGTHTHTQAITFLGTVGDYIVSGAKDGFVRFYDPLLRIVAWFEDLEAGPVTSVSFSAALPAKVGNQACLSAALGLRVRAGDHLVPCSPSSKGQCAAVLRRNLGHTWHRRQASVTQPCTAALHRNMHTWQQRQASVPQLCIEACTHDSLPVRVGECPSKNLSLIRASKVGRLWQAEEGDPWHCLFCCLWLCLTRCPCHCHRLCCLSGPLLHHPVLTLSLLLSLPISKFFHDDTARP